MHNQTKPKDNQDCFNRAWEYFSDPDFVRCVNENGICCYRAKFDDKNRACVIGDQMPDRLANKYAASILDLINEESSVKRWFGNVDIKLLRMLQNLHDTANVFATTVEDRHRYLRVIAKALNLEVPK